ncbi:unnamed protein product [Gongylonema pulchrum]|uniref:Exonuclease domain-containing protein n=1 Tax=Gongylonema pulchrum TaxID=637853 RepID=A0A3P7R3V4_9BILA|nr:unnamed protein product [Gongylonema pulchrum]
MYARLKKHFRKEFTIIKNGDTRRYKTEMYYDYFVVMDFECTCEAELYDYEHEIIEFPAILVDVHRREILIIAIIIQVDIFHSYVRPTLHPQLSEFCINLTGVTQEMVDKAMPFIDVLDSFRAWMQSHHLGQKGVHYAFITDGSVDFFDP